MLAEQSRQGKQRTWAAAAAVAALQIAVAGVGGGAAARADVLISSDWPENAPTGDGWYRIAGFTDYADGQAPTNGAGISRIDVNGDAKLKYVNANGQYWGQIVGQSWANPAISIPNMQANPVVEFDLDLSQANWGGLTIRADIENKGTSTGDVTSTHNYDFAHLTVKNRGTNPIVQHVSIDLSQLSIPVQSLENGTGDQNLLLYFQPAYYGFWDPTANGGAGAWVDQYVTQTYVIDNLWLTNGPVKVNAAWNADANGNFSDAAQWAGGLPGGAGHTANFGSTKSDGGAIAAHTITVDAPVTVGVLNFYNPNSQTLAGTSTITLENAAHVAAAINVASGSHTIAAPLAFVVDTPVDVSNAASTLTISALAETDATLIKKGAGKVILSNIRSGGLDVRDGTVEIAQNGTAAGASRAAVLSIGNDAKLDLKDNKLITATLPGTAANGVYLDGSVQGDVQRAYAEGTWGGNGLTTSMPQAAEGLTTIAVATGDQLGVSTFAGQSVAPTDTVAFYTYAGDTNFDGQISGDDYGTIDFAILVPGADGYYNGDFNYDGVINGDDYGVIDFAIIAQGAPFSTAGAAAGLSGVAAVPEPTTCAFALAAGAVAMLRRRRRRAEK